MLSQFKHVIGIKQLFADPAGTRLFFVDDKVARAMAHAVSLTAAPPPQDDVFVYNAVNDAVYPLPGLVVRGACDVLWDVRPLDQGALAVVQRDTITTVALDVNHYLGRLPWFSGAASLAANAPARPAPRRRGHNAA